MADRGGAATNASTGEVPGCLAPTLPAVCSSDANATAGASLAHAKPVLIQGAWLSVDGAAVTVDQSALTGESLPVTARAGQHLLMGSLCRRGEGRARSRTGRSEAEGRARRLSAVATGAAAGILPLAFKVLSKRRI